MEICILSEHLFVQEQRQGSILLEDSHGWIFTDGLYNKMQHLEAQTHLSRAGSGSKGAANLTRAFLMLKLQE